VGIQDKMSQFAGNVQEGAKQSFFSLVLWSLKFFTAVLIGLTLALIGQEMMSYGTLAFSFVLVSMTAAILKVISPWTIVGVLIFDLICILLALLLRMYILVAP
jgi:hypothetical protein